jgi:hypothetical protein
LAPQNLLALDNVRIIENDVEQNSFNCCTHELAIQLVTLCHRRHEEYAHSPAALGVV